MDDQLKDKSPENVTDVKEDKVPEGKDPGSSHPVSDLSDTDNHRDEDKYAVGTPEDLHRKTEEALIQSIQENITLLPRAQKRSLQDRELSMMLKTRGRALSQALMTIAGTRQRSGRLWLTCAVTLVVIVLLVIQVFYRHRELNLGYELSAAISQREALLEENRKLRIELRVLSRRERLEPLAGKQLGMSVIRPEQVLIVRTPNVPKKAVDPGKRLDGLDNVKRIGEK